MLETRDDQVVDDVLLAYDQVLRRRVWIQADAARSTRSRCRAAGPRTTRAPSVADRQADACRMLGCLRRARGASVCDDCPGATIVVGRAVLAFRRGARTRSDVSQTTGGPDLDVEHVWITAERPGNPSGFSVPRPSSHVRRRRSGHRYDRETTDRAFAFVRRLATVALGQRGPTSAPCARIPKTTRAGTLAKPEGDRWGAAGDTGQKGRADPTTARRSSGALCR